MITLFGSIFTFASSPIIFAQESNIKIPSSPKIVVDGNIADSVLIGPLEILTPLIAIALIVILIIQVTKYLLDNRLKNKIIDRGISEQLASSILEKSAADKKEDSIKWAILLLGLSGGITAIYFTKPIDIHSFAIMLFSAGFSYLIYFFYLQKKRR